MKYLSILIIIFLSGCGTFVPKLRVLEKDQVFTLDVHYSILCEVIDSIKLASDQAKELSEKRGLDVNFFDKWGILYTVSLKVVENSRLNPTITNLSTLTPAAMLSSGVAVLTLDAGFNFSAKATRTETAQVFRSVKLLKSLKQCPKGASKNKIAIAGTDLKLKGWLLPQLSLVDTGLISSQSSKESFTYKVEFEIGKTGSIDPKWSFIRRKLSKATGLFSASRTSTHSVLFTVGPVDPGRLTLEQNAISVHNAQLINQALN